MHCMQTDRQTESETGKAIFLPPHHHHRRKNPFCKRAYGEIRFGDVCLSIGVRVGSNCSVNQRCCGLPASPATC